MQQLVSHKFALLNLGGTTVPIDKGEYLWSSVTIKKKKKSWALKTFICAGLMPCQHETTQLPLLFNAVQCCVKWICTSLCIVPFIVTKPVMLYITMLTMWKHAYIQHVYVTVGLCHFVFTTFLYCHSLQTTGIPSLSVFFFGLSLSSEARAALLWQM